MSRIKLKFIADKSVTSDALKLIQWDSTGDLAYVPDVAGNWVVAPTGALEGLDELAQRVSALSPLTQETKTANFTAEYNKRYLVSNSINMQLPAVLSGQGDIEVKIVDGGNVTILRAAAEKIEFAAADFVTSSVHQGLKIFNNNTDWFFI